MDVDGAMHRHLSGEGRQSTKIYKVSTYKDTGRTYIYISSREIWSCRQSIRLN